MPDKPSFVTSTMNEASGGEDLDTSFLFFPRLRLPASLFILLMRGVTATTITYNITTTTTRECRLRCFEL
ncbi:hypothetical protein E2C01_081295 [Portunus trituberculatus]|uniref:Uncharacterized protein n=1 Tax=Portunus trituberculatus TaxID=210409 RepID=A0A5B7IXL1_PORTR|nr:hypothetical protein [Portunus trituberculatus]